MIEEYCNRLKILQADRLHFQRNQQKVHFTHQMLTQESKYQTYIIDQINSKEQILAIANIYNLLNHKVYSFKNSALQKITFHFKVQLKHNQSKQNLRNFALRNIIKIFQNAKASNERYFVTKFVGNCNEGKSLNKMIKIFEHFVLKTGLRQIISVKWLKVQDQYFIQSNKAFGFEQFSIIEKNVRNQMDDSNQLRSDSCLNCIQEKHNSCSVCQDNAERLPIQDIQKIKIKQEILILKKALAEKTLEIKSQNEEMERLQENYEHKIHRIYSTVSDKIKSECIEEIEESSKDSFYYQNLESQLIGDRRVTPNNTSSESHHFNPNFNRLEQELMSKYMKEAFESKEKIDYARQLCLLFKFGSQSNQKILMEQIIALLSPLDSSESEVD